jgi:hypothetical protein
MKTNGFSTSIAVIIILTIIISIGGAFYQQFLADIRYATLDEKEASKEVLVQSESEFSNFDISEYDAIRDALEKYLIPVYKKLEKSITKINSAGKEINKINIALTECLTIMNQCKSDIFEEQSNANGKFKDFLNALNSSFVSVIANLENTLGHSMQSEINIANTNMLISNIKNFFNLYCYDLLALINVINDNYNLSNLYSNLYSTISDMDYNPLIDLDTPYFSLPKEYAEAKEKQIFSYIEGGRNDPQSIMALIILYIKMRNITDAEEIYYNLISRSSRLTQQEKDLAKTIEMMFDEIRFNNPQAYLDNANINIESNLSANIIEHYSINNAVDGKDVYIFLPYSRDDIIPISLLDTKEQQLSIKEINSTWKNSCYIMFSCYKGLSEFNFKYKVKSSFFNYSKEYGTYEYKYGGINNNNNFVCTLSLPSILKPTVFRDAPDEVRELENGTNHEIVWSNPVLPYKIELLKFVSNKNGISGEILHMRLMYERWNYSVFTLCIYFLLILIFSHFVKREKAYEIIFVFLSLAALFVLYFDTRFIFILQRITSVMSPISLQIIYIVILIIAYICLYLINFDRGNRYFQIVVLILIFSVGINVLYLFWQNQDKSNMKNAILSSLNVAYFLYLLVTHISRKLRISKLHISVLLIVLSVYSLFISNFIKTVYLSKAQLDYIGLIIAIIFVLLSGLSFLVEHKTKIRMTKNPKRWELFLDYLGLHLQGKTIPITNILLILMIFISLISRMSWFAIIGNLVLTIFAPEVLKKLKNNNK